MEPFLREVTLDRRDSHAVKGNYAMAIPIRWDIRSKDAKTKGVLHVGAVISFRTRKSLDADRRAKPVPRKSCTSALTARDRVLKERRELPCRHCRRHHVYVAKGWTSFGRADRKRPRKKHIVFVAHEGNE